MGWKRIERVGRSEGFFKWEEVRQTVEGTWKGTVEGEHGELGQIETASGVFLSFPMHTVLTRVFEDIEEGTQVKIVYLGQQASKKSGHFYKNFDVFFNEEEAHGD